ncbi:hypothetical protein J5N97_020794 [Dioscorea zingiberensis]|uniref:Uncharacterized protein n=1 Tax=Dioscorea zingiberensis TaxID=325984 RepID=A0A9D5CIQ5_9LILI|nr:hypothetical protein J5N97_020794 [Dioscorea zingiberensis]
MKREGRQHGMGRTHVNLLQPQFNPKFKAEEAANISGEPPVTGQYTRVVSKPTNHSKYTGKCRKVRCLECHSHPVTKSRDKAKGAYKLKSCDVSKNHRLVSWRVAGNGSAWKYSGISASEILSQLLGDHLCDEVHDDEHDGDENFVEFGEGLEEEEIPLPDMVVCENLNTIEPVFDVVLIIS